MMKFHQQLVELQLLGHCGLIAVEGLHLVSAEWVVMFY